MLDPEDVMAVLSNPPNDLPAGRQYAESGVVIFNFSVSARRRLLSHGRGGIRGRNDKRAREVAARKEFFIFLSARRTCAVK